MNAWIIFLKERVPLITYGFLSVGLALSGFVLAGGTDYMELIIPFIGLLLFFVVLRLMDEYKDYDKDKVAHPGRPLPRGVVSTDHVRRAIYTGLVLMGSVALVTLQYNREAAICYVFIGLYLWLMYKEFYSGTWLSRHPLLYAASHQFILIPICLYPALAVNPEALQLPQALGFGILVLSSFFAYEICRKLDPDSHPILKTYLTHYGVRITSIFIISLSLAGAIVAWYMGLGHLLWPFQAVLVASLILLKNTPERYKVVERIATLSLIAHIWVIAIDGYLL